MDTPVNVRHIRFLHNSKDCYKTYPTCGGLYRVYAVPVRSLFSVLDCLYFKRLSHGSSSFLAPPHFPWFHNSSIFISGSISNSTILRTLCLDYNRDSTFYLYPCKEWRLFCIDFFSFLAATSRLILGGTIPESSYSFGSDVGLLIHVN